METVKELLTRWKARCAHCGGSCNYRGTCQACLTRLVNAAVRQEREECAVICDNTWGEEMTTGDCAGSIRARGKKGGRA